MNCKQHQVLAGLCALVVSATYTSPAMSQTSEVKEKPPMYTYVANWVLPRARWGDMQKDNANNNKLLEKDLANGTLVGYGNDETLVHQEGDNTQDGWWSAMSMAGVINVLEEFYKAGNATTSVLNAATKHWDEIYVSRYYNWHSGSHHGAYTHVASYKLKDDAPNDAVDILSKTLIVPLLEKLLADGTLLEYEVDEEAIHTVSPSQFLVDYICVSADGLDKVNAALAAAIKSSPLSGPAFGSMVDFSVHRDELARTDATYK